MKIAWFLLKEFAKIILRKNYASHSDLVRGYRMYFGVDVRKKSFWKVNGEVLKLFRYWECFPDSYFREAMFEETYIDWNRILSYVPQDAYYRMSKDTNRWYHIVLDDKILFHDLMSYYGVPVPHRFFVYRGGEFRSGQKFLSDKEVNEIIYGISDQRIFMKRFTGGAASGVSVLVRNEQGCYVDAEGDAFSAALIRSKYGSDDYIFEQQLIQEPTLRQFNPDTVNTIRVLTYKNKPISAAVRFGSKGGFVDNTAMGGVAVSLDIETGYLGDYGCREYDINKYYCHPDSKIPFKGTHVTQWEEIKQLVERVCALVPYYNSIGFDIATTDAGPVIIEINNGAGIYLSQMGKTTGLAKYFVKK